MASGLTGTIPSCIGNALTYLQQLYVLLVPRHTRSRGLVLFVVTIIYKPFYRDLSTNNLTGTIPASIGNLGLLATLYFVDPNDSMLCCFSVFFLGT